MSDLRDRLARLGLSQYYDVFAAEGFDTWDTVLDITESDLSHLSVKLGHRRKLQRAIAESRGQSTDHPLPTGLVRPGSAGEIYRSDDSGPESKNKPSTTGVGGASTKRKYRRHPKADDHAPERPPSAYVIFSNHVRELLKGQDLSFTEIAKVVGEKWQVLPAEERESFERQANSAKEKYYAELAEYKKTPHFEVHQRYLEDFRIKHQVPTKEVKRSKLETGTNTPRAGSQDRTERAANRRLSSAQPEPYLVGLQNPELNQSRGPSRLAVGHSNSSKPPSPAYHARSEFNSPRSGEQFSPASASPRPASNQREGFFEISSTQPIRDARISFDANVYHQQPVSGTDSHHQAVTTTPPMYAYQAHYPTPVELTPRRPIRDSARPPPVLSHEDTTLSSESGHSGQGFPLAGYSGQPLPMDPTKTMRMLPQPVPSMGPSPSILDRPPPVLAPHLLHQVHDYRTQGPLAVLVRAGEIASRAAEDDAMATEGSP
ncbi:hypothetical protein EJ02DRAFT_44340 [Clathrospora elynae]|uniref:HMG box domain-containing protein n=1 Tax=Clathrospora elynae TaxID=706981 RepID=A0A6A5SZM0_9PLEO|nr:hypothetical protein EJ02DRAFT_44340 [Clathrospora elynae]